MPWPVNNSPDVNPLDAVTNYYRHGDLKGQNAFSLRLEVRNIKIRVSAQPHSIKL